MNIYDFAIMGFALVIYVVQTYLHRQQIKSLLNRIMAKDLEQFQYFTETYKKDIKRQDKILDKAIEEEEVDVNAGNEATDKFLRDVEEDFDANEIDMDKLKASMRNEEKE